MKEPGVTGLKTSSNYFDTSCCFATGLGNDVAVAILPYFEFTDRALFCSNANVCVKTFKMRNIYFPYSLRISSVHITFLTFFYILLISKGKFFSVEI